jgi:hypothetical protein
MSAIKGLDNVWKWLLYLLDFTNETHSPGFRLGTLARDFPVEGEEFSDVEA